jgi:hypothetical protein
VCVIVSFCGLGSDVCILELCILMLVEDLSEVGKSLAGGLYGCCLWGGGVICVDICEAKL